jgi:hypothetical protein
MPDKRVCHFGRRAAEMYSSDSATNFPKSMGKQTSGKTPELLQIDNLHVVFCLQITLQIHMKKGLADCRNSAKTLILWPNQKAQRVLEKC